MVVVIFIGLPGTGKTTLASELFNKLKNATYLSSDTIRRAIFQHYFETEFESELYETKNVDTVYNVINYLIGKICNSYNYVIVDATFHLERRRVNLIKKLDELSQTYFIFNTETNKKIIKKRMKERQDKSIDSDALYKEYQKLEQEWESIDPSKFKSNYYKIDTSFEINVNLGKILTILRLDH